MTPSEGARLLLERESVTDDGRHARYRARIYTPSECFEYGAVLSLDGEATLAPQGAPADQELETRLGNIARSTARAAQRKIEEGLPPWPPRVLRWRGPGRG